jgi:hypothetical protein
MPDPQKLLATIRKATQLTRATPGRKGSLVTVDDAEEMMVVGDLHGNLPAFRTALAVAALEAHQARHLVFQELIHELGGEADDRPDRSHRLVDLFCALKCQHPVRVHLILGNHELSELTGRPIGKDGLALNRRFQEGLELSYGPSADEIYRAYLELFSALPLAVRTPNRVFVCHTIPDAASLESLDLSLLHADHWPEAATKRGGTIYALTWGRDTSPETVDRFAAMVDADWFVTGHQPCQEGFRQANHRQIIVDGTNPRPAYCLFPARQPVSIETLLGAAAPLDLPRSN